jgi:type III restriction enzyme
MLLDGQNFSPESIRGMLTICVLSYNSLRIDSKKKDIRKIYQENGNLMSFAQYFKNDDILLAETPETALIQIIRQLFPVTIVDESHNAGSVLSVEMLNNLNPSFVLDLTATPRKNSNIISYVDARELKKENMVKLPVIVFKRNTKESVIKDAIQLRESIDKQAVDSEKKGGDYIRPIVLFQAQPNINQESETFEKIKKTLIDIGIPSEQIAIKTSQIDDLKKVDLMSRECSVKYIITVNALKEGWDCPFAYILASLANKNSKVDIEQILGRILRQPYAKQHSTQMLNSSYVLTCSDDFQNTLESIVRGLNRSGFSRKDYRIGGNSEIDISTKINSKAEDEKLENIEAEDSAQEEPISSLDDDIFSVQEIIDMEDVAIQAIEDYESKNREESSQGYPGGELDNIVKKYKVQVQFADEIKEMRIPQFFFKIKPNQFANGNILVEPENLSAGFSLDKLDAQITFNTENNDMFVVDIQEEGEAVPKYKIANRKEATIHQYLEPLSKQEKKYKMY